MNTLLAWPGRLRQLAGEESVAVPELPDVEIGLVQRTHGKVLVLPAEQGGCKFRGCVTGRVVTGWAV
ncbi:hypothetical protein [Micromonospora matsumotoense]|uniref:hypothetical protein n=1 Tax=Micromonospora matsumotoense TaxID=121616 RepID=UPI0033E0E37C